MKTQNRRLMWHGMLLFLLGLITGLLEQGFTLVLWGLRGTAAEVNDSWKHSEFTIRREAEGRRS